MIDILLSTYNGEKYLKEQLDSILNQTFKDIHIIIRDDKSEDGTVKILKEYEKKYPGIFELHIEKKNIGCKESFFQLMNYSKSEYVMLSDQDDVWMSDKIECSLQYIKKVENNKPALVYTDVYVVDKKLQIIRKSAYSNRRNPNHTSLNKLLFSTKAYGMTMIMNRKLISLCKFPKDKRIEMHDTWLEYISTSLCGKYFLNKPTVLYRQHSSNISGIAFDNPIMSFINGMKIAKQFMIRKRENAQVFLENYIDLLNHEQIETITNFIYLNKYNIFKKAYLIKKYDYSTGFFLHYISLLLL